MEMSSFRIAERYFLSSSQLHSVGQSTPEHLKQNGQIASATCQANESTNPKTDHVHPGWKSVSEDWEGSRGPADSLELRSQAGGPIDVHTHQPLHISGENCCSQHVYWACTCLIAVNMQFIELAWSERRFLVRKGLSTFEVMWDLQTIPFFGTTCICTLICTNCRVLVKQGRLLPPHRIDVSIRALLANCA